MNRSLRDLETMKIDTHILSASTTRILAEQNLALAVSFGRLASGATAELPASNVIGRTLAASAPGDSPVPDASPVAIHNETQARQTVARAVHLLHADPDAAIGAHSFTFNVAG